METSQDQYFGSCPLCGKNNGYLNIGRSHFFRCDEHETKWCIGSNLFSSWHDETEDVWQQNSILLSSYREVQPVYPIDDLLNHDLSGESMSPGARDLSSHYPHAISPSLPPHRTAPPFLQPPLDPQPLIYELSQNLLLAGISVQQFISWLNHIGTVPDGTAELEQVNARWIRMILDDWQGIQIQVTNFLNDSYGGRFSWLEAQDGVGQAE
jgi:hypothetical protein